MFMDNQKSITIVGGGMIGNVAAVSLAKTGHIVNIYQRYQDPRIIPVPKGKSMNLGINERGLQIFDKMNLRNQILRNAVPMYGRMQHNVDGTEKMFLYGKNNQTVYSVRREDLYSTLVKQVDNYTNIRTQFNRMCVDVDLQNTAVKFINPSTKKESIVKSDIILGCDGHFSKVRLALQTKSNFNMSQMYIEHGYKQITIVADKNGKHQLYPNALHIWLRKNFTIVAFPNTNGTFSCALLLDKIGQESYQSLKDQNSIIKFFQKYFPELIPLMPNLVENILTHPLCNLGAISCGPWNYGGKICLLGDSAHAMLPYLALSLNCGLQDCFLFDKLINQQVNWEIIFSKLFQERKHSSDIISQMTFGNYQQIKYKQNDPKFNLMKKIEGKIIAQNKTYIHINTIVTSYPQYNLKQIAMEAKRRKYYLEQLVQIKNIFEKWENPQVKGLIKQLIEDGMISKKQQPMAKL